MSSQSEYHPQLGSSWTTSRVVLFMFVGLVIAAFLGWIFFHPTQIAYGNH